MMLENLTAFGGESNAEGSILLGEEDSVVELHNVVFFDNHTTSNGGAVKIQGGALFVWNSEFSYNSSGGMGGALYVENGEFYDEGSSFVANEGLEGGGLAMMGGSLMLSETRFKGNIAMDGGGAWVRDIEDVLLTDVELLDNEASRSGGGLALINATVPYVFKGMHVQGNSALDSGGGIWLVGAHGVGILANSTFVDNIAGVSGGGVYMDPDASSGGNWIWSNVFSYGGGLFLSGSAAGNVAFNLCWDVVAPCLSISEEMDFGENLDEDPLFVNFIDDGNLVGDNLSLDVGSPGIDSGPLDGEGPIYFLDWNDEDGSRNDRGHTGGF
jgi:predicted outer membrane repeat protein